MTREIDEGDLTVGKPKRWAAGLPGVLVSLKRSVEQMGTATTVTTLRLLNQRDGFDCPGCAWPEPREVDGGKRRAAEFCENGAKAVAEEATTRRLGPEFFAAHSLADLDGRSEYWLGQQGRLTHPVVKRPGATHYEEISWDDAFTLIAPSCGRYRGNPIVRDIGADLALGPLDQFLQLRPEPVDHTARRTGPPGSSRPSSRART